MRRTWTWIRQPFTEEDKFILQGHVHIHTLLHVWNCERTAAVAAVDWTKLVFRTGQFNTLNGAYGRRGGRLNFVKKLGSVVIS